ncbi:MAG: hypothetical protein ABJB69_08870 [Spartobacteria bacterium]
MAATPGVRLKGPYGDEDVDLIGALFAPALASAKRSSGAGFCLAKDRP